MNKQEMFEECTLEAVEDVIEKLKFFSTDLRNRSTTMRDIERSMVRMKRYFTILDTEFSIPVEEGRSESEDIC
jgi:hypothetical protein